MSYDGRAIANFVLDTCEASGREITNLSLQKIVYFCHVWSLVKLNKPLVKQKFEAWQFGPVLQYLYRDFKRFERSPITSRAQKLNSSTGNMEVVPYNFDEDTGQFLKIIVDTYSSISAANLVQISHAQGSPWDEAWNHHDGINPGMVINDEAIQKYYSRIDNFALNR